MKKPLMKKPVGPSKLGHGFGTDWNNQGIGTLAVVVCEICGTKHPKLDDSETSRTISRFMDYQVVEECCGGIIDHVYLELGREFAIAFLEEFADNPGDSRFYMLRCTLVDTSKKAQQNLAEVSGQVAEISEAAVALDKP
jgi:hypothetical protein